jgi:hypothetical protein
MSTNIKVFKLVSGEEIIGDVLDTSDENSFKISKPMVFQTSTMLDGKGYPYDVTTLKDWLLRTDEKIAEISKDKISMFFSPNEQTKKLYDLELTRISEAVEEELIKGDEFFDKMDPSGNSLSFDEIMNNFIDGMNNLVDDAQGFDEPPPPPKKKKKKKFPKQDEFGIQSFIPDELKKRPMIYLSMVIPPEAIMNLISAGILDPDQLLAMIEEVKKNNKFTGDEKKRKDFGNKMSDWNPDPESHDYE